jgi:hypothetical protein
MDIFIIIIFNIISKIISIKSIITINNIITRDSFARPFKPSQAHGGELICHHTVQENGPCREAKNYSQQPRRARDPLQRDKSDRRIGSLTPFPQHFIDT